MSRCHGQPLLRGDAAQGPPRGLYGVVDRPRGAPVRIGADRGRVAGASHRDAGVGQGSDPRYGCRADCAIRASRHRWPKGHLLAYVKLEQINADSLGALPKINGTVEGGLERVAEMALNKNFPGAGAEMGKVLEGCSNCHNLFRFGKGESPYIID